MLGEELNPRTDACDGETVNAVLPANRMLMFARQEMTGRPVSMPDTDLDAEQALMFFGLVGWLELVHPRLPGARRLRNQSGSPTGPGRAL